MNFEDDRFVRLFTRNTPTWCSWKWPARAVWPSLMRALDRSGKLEWAPGSAPESAVAAVIMFPANVVAVGLSELVRTKTVVLGDGWLEAPNFVLAQNCRSRAKTGAERMAECRLKKASQGGLVTRRDDSSQNVTKVTNVTLSSAQLSSAQVKTPPYPPAGGGCANDPPGEESAGLLLATQPPSTPKAAKRRKPRTTVPADLAESAYAAFSSARAELTGRPPRAFTESMRDALAKLYAASPFSAEEWAAVVRHRLGMDRRGEGFGSLTWASLTVSANFERWLLDSQRGGLRPKSGPAPVSTRPKVAGVVDMRALATAKDRAP